MKFSVANEPYVSKVYTLIVLCGSGLPRRSRIRFRVRRDSTKSAGTIVHDRNGRKTSPCERGSIPMR